MALDHHSTNSTKNCRVFIIPHLSKGHLIPMTDFAKLLTTSHPNIEPTMVVTPGNATFINSSSSSSSNQLKILTYPFPSEGPKTGSETVGVGSKEESSLINEKSWFIRPSVEEIITTHKPDVVVADTLFSWAPGVAAGHQIPCILFFCSGVFPLVVYRKVNEMKPDMGVDNVVTISDLPGMKLGIPARELPNYPHGEDAASNRILDSTFGCQPNTVGIVFNTFRGFEGEYCEEYESKAQIKKAYFIGPVSSYYNVIKKPTLESRPKPNLAHFRGGEGDTACLKWLDNKDDGSVVFVGFGSQCYFKPEQLRELATGLERSGTGFLWAVRGDNMDEWAPEGWWDRTSGRGFVVTDWAPQVAILAHPAIGAFMTHCGWNSVLEGVSAGIPMLTWPFAAEEFINERLLVEVIGCAVRVWNGKRSVREEDTELVPASAIAGTISKFMGTDTGMECEAIRLKARNVGIAARAAVEEGGSSRADIKSLVNDLFELLGTD